MTSSRRAAALASILVLSVVLNMANAAPASSSPPKHKHHRHSQQAEPKPSDPIDLEFPTKNVPTTVSGSSLVTADRSAALADTDRHMGFASSNRSSPVTLATSARAAAVNFDFDVLGIGQAIAGAVNVHQNRDAFVKNLANTAFYNAHQRYHVMVFNLNIAHAYSLRGVRAYGSADYHGIVFGVWVFESGWFENRGDGGYINWAFIGRFDRNGGHVTFH